MLGLLAVAMIAVPAQIMAQSTNAPAPKKQRHPPIHGKVAALDATAKTIKVAETTYEVTADARITKDGAPAKLEDGAVGEDVSIVFMEQDGKKVATRVYFGHRPEKKAPPAAPSAPQTDSK
jgi:hypothetical protein